MQRDNRLRPHGRSGLKYLHMVLEDTNMARSPPTRAEWIEISMTVGAKVEILSPPTRAEWIEISTDKGILNSIKGLRPHGRSGLKSLYQSFRP